MNKRIEAIASRFLKDPLEIRPHASLYRQAAIYEIRTEQGAWGLKRFRGTVEEIAYVTAFLQHLEAEGYQGSPRLLLSHRGEPFVRDGDACYYATSWYEKGGRFDPRRTDLVESAGRTLASLHHTSLSFTGRLKKRHVSGREGVNFRAKHDLFLKKYARLKRKEPNARFMRLLATDLPLLLKETDAALQHLTGPQMKDYLAERNVRQNVCHRDITLPNLLVAANTSQVHLIDFDTAGHSIPLYDLDRLLSNCFDWEADAMIRALRAYHREHPLSENALHLLGHQILLPKEEWQLVKKFADRSTSENDKALSAMLERILKRKADKRAAVQQVLRLSVHDL